MTHDNILSLLAGSNSQQPVPFNALLAKCGLAVEALDAVLDQMYATRQINQAMVTRSGIQQREVWPVSMVNHANPYRMGIPMPPVLPALRPGEVAPVLNTNVAKQPKALTILKYIEANPNCNSAQISHATGIESPRSYIKAHISRGAVLVSGDNRKDMKMQLAAGHTAQAIYGNGYTKAKPKAKPAPSAALLAEVQAAHANVDLPVGRVGFQPHAEPAPTYEIPAFLAKSEEQQPVEPAPVVKFDTDLGLYPVEKIASQPTLQDHIDALFMLLPESASIVITRNAAQLEIDIEAEVFGRSVCKSVSMHQVKETLDALHIVTVEMV